MDIAFSKANIAAIESDIPTEQSAQVIDVTGKLVTPGLIDLHAHVFSGCTNLGIAVRELLLWWMQAVLVGLLLRAVTLVFGLVHISTLGLIYSGIGEMLNIDYANSEWGISITEFSEILKGD
ncbi:TPA: hypothetical protein EYP66_08495, partial [Candidatus Poribacteria bacterium]|nr:hypothetical protein [Candidatus Poribacteria bacterium]